MEEREAQTIALEALAFLASEPERLERFLVNTGLTGDELAARASDNDTLVSVLDAVLADESTVLMFAAERQVKAERIYPARIKLSGTYDVST